MHRVTISVSVSCCLSSPSVYFRFEQRHFQRSIRDHHSGFKEVVLEEHWVHPGQYSLNKSGWAEASSPSFDTAVICDCTRAIVSTGVNRECYIERFSITGMGCAALIHS